MSQIASLIQRLDSWLQEYRPDYYARLNPGATVSEISALESFLGWNLPEDFRTFYKWKNGSTPRFDFSGQGYEFTYYWEFHSTERIVQFNAPRYFVDSWLIFSDDMCGDYLILDALGAQTGNPFQIVEHIKGDMSRISNSSFSKWLACQLHLMESGNLLRFMSGEYNSWEDMQQWDKDAWQYDPGYPITFDTIPYLA